VVVGSLHAAGFEVIRRGWPDFIAVHPVTGEVRFVEVKSTPNSHLSLHQKRVAEVLLPFGIHVELVNPFHPERKQ
jgi:Holliday junction resolvase